MKNIIFYLSLLVTTMVSFTTSAEQESPTFSDAELAQMLAPIALYPDSLLTHILIASTYPIEIIEAHRWLKKNDNLNIEQKNKLLYEFDWDASVKALIPFDRVLSRLSEDLSWTRKLGDAFLQDEPRLLVSIQALRKQAKLAGSLNKMDNMDIDYEDENISILSREKDVVYVPYYDSRMVYGSWFWSGYPPVYWHPQHSAYVSNYRPFYWHSGVHITFNYFFSAFHWHNRHVVVVNPHRTHYRYSHQRPRRLIANGGYAKRWSHKPSHRKGVAYRTARTSEKYGSKHVGAHRVSNKFNASHRNVKQRLHASKHSQQKANVKAKNKLNRKANHRSNHKVKQNNVNSRQTSKHSALQQKQRSTGVSQHKSGRQVSEKTRKPKTNTNKRVASSVRKDQHRTTKASRSNTSSRKASSHKASRQNGASTKRRNSNIEKNRK
jgi:hypothetical protein